MNRPVAVKDANEADIVRFTYDSQSRRIAPTEGTNTTLYLYDAWNSLAEYCQGIGGGIDNPQGLM